MTSIYKKTTNIYPCTLNFQSECLFCYKRTIMKAIISRAKLQSSSRTVFLNELRNIKQTLFNNGFPNYIVDTEMKQFINKTDQHNIDNDLNHKQSINLYYKNQFHCNYKIDKHRLKKNIIQKNVLPTDPTKKDRLIIYYNKSKTSNLIISNNISPSTEFLDRTNVVYIYIYIYIYVQMSLGRLSPKKIVRMLVLPQQLFQDNLQCTLMILVP